MDEKVMWWQAYLAALTGIGTYIPANGRTAYCVVQADAALEAYRKRWGGEES